MTRRAPKRGRERVMNRISTIAGVAALVILAALFVGACLYLGTP